MNDALLSIHDVMPETLDPVRSIVNCIVEMEKLPCTLLVVPGCPWTDSDLDLLREWQTLGFELAGHGWTHECVPKSAWHKLHSLVFSRNVAEHLALSQEGIEDLIARCHQWFIDRDFPPPQLYVPPAWAMGAISRSKLRELPFEQYEFLRGIYLAETNRYTWLPIAGFESDTPLRKIALRSVNLANRVVARLAGRPLRIAIHPFDFSHRLAGDLGRVLQGPYAMRAYSKTFAP